MKSQMKALAAAEVNPWRNFKQKKETPVKKPKVEPPRVAVGGAPKSVYKSGVSSTTGKGRHSVSPLPSPPEISGAPSPSFGTGNHAKGQTGVEGFTPIQATNKENLISSEKELPGRATSGTGSEKPNFKGNSGTILPDLQSVLISLLMDKPKGMSLKALEKSVGDVIPNSVKKIEPILKKIATFEASGRYILKPGVELENYKKLSSESGSSPEDNHFQTPGPEENRDQVPIPKHDLSDNAAATELEEQTELNHKFEGESNALEKIDILHHSPDLFGDKKVSDNSEGPAGSSSDSGSDSDSDSDSSGSGSDSGSHSRSRSKSPVRSGSGSSSDSESDASTNSKEGSDEDVDIMTSDDDKETKPNLQSSEPGFSTSPIPWRTPDGGPAQNMNDEKRDGHGSDIVEIHKVLQDDDQETVMAVISNSNSYDRGGKPLEECKLSSPYHQKHQVYSTNLHSEKETMDVGNFLGEKETVHKVSPKQEQFDSYGRILVKHKRASDARHSDENSERAKRLKAGNLGRSQISRGRDSLFSRSPRRLSPDGLIDDPNCVPSAQTKNRFVKEGNADPSVQKVYKQGVPEISATDSPELGQKSIDPSVRIKAPDMVERAGKHAESSGHGSKNSGRNLPMHEGLMSQKDKVHTEIQRDDGYPNEKKLPKSSKNGGFGERNAVSVEPHYMKHGEPVGKSKEAGQISNFHMSNNGKTNVDKSPVINGRGGSMLQRGLSDLELGELREPLTTEQPAAKKQFERKSSFKQLENRSASDFRNTDSGKAKPAVKAAADSRHLSSGVPSNPEDPIKKRKFEHHGEDSARSHPGAQSQSQQSQRLDNSGAQINKITDVSGKTRQNEAGVSDGISLEGYGDIRKKALINASQQHDAKRGLVTTDSKVQRSGTLAVLADRRKDTSVTENIDDVLKRKESSPDENSCSYSKYEKEEPELKGPIKVFSQYQEYVQEYREKYESYCSLNKILESYRNEFHKLGRDLEISKGKDMERYRYILGQLRESYNRCGERHKRLKKIFVVLHEELKHLKQIIRDYAVSYARD